MWWIVYSLQSTTNHRQIFKITKTGDLPLGNQADPSGLAQNWPLSHRTGQILSTKKTIPLGENVPRIIIPSVWNSILFEITPRSSGESSIWAIRRYKTPMRIPSWRLLCRVLFQLCSQQKKHDNMRFTELLNIRYCQNLSDTWNVRSFARSTTASQKIRPSCCLIRGAQLQDRPPAKCTDRFAEKLRDFKKIAEWCSFAKLKQEHLAM